MFFFLMYFRVSLLRDAGKLTRAVANPTLSLFQVVSGCVQCSSSSSWNRSIFSLGWKIIAALCWPLNCSSGAAEALKPHHLQSATQLDRHIVPIISGDWGWEEKGGWGASEGWGVTWWRRRSILDPPTTPHQTSQPLRSRTIWCLKNQREKSSLEMRRAVHYPGCTSLLLNGHTEKWNCVVVPSDACQLFSRIKVGSSKGVVGRTQ